MLEDFQACGEHVIAKEKKDESITDGLISVEEDNIKFYEVVSASDIFLKHQLSAGETILADSTKIKKFKDYVIIKEEDIIAFKKADKTPNNETDQENTKEN